MKWRRTRNAAREEAFARDLMDTDWSSLEDRRDVDGMTDCLEKVIGELTEKHFPLARVRKRSNESPWITRSIRRLWKKKIRIYKKSGKNDEWWSTDRLLQKKIRESRNNFVETMLEEGNTGRSFYTATKKLSLAAPTPPWEVGDLFVGLEPKEIADEVLGFYGNIAGSATDPVTPDVPRCNGGLGVFSVERMTELLRGAKKTDSRVDGDPLAHLVRRYPESFASPVGAIYNRINEEGRWPKSWKTEHLMIIPKNPNPSDLSECRNISCTSIFSKILEGAVLLKLRGELQPDRCQYGGAPKCGAEHLLVDICEKVLVALEGGQNSAVLLGVDYEKAFNRMDHLVCLNQLRKLGASNGSIALVRAFLEDRQMTINIDGQKATPIPIKKGSPQGSVLGCLLYCVTTQSLTSGLRGDDYVRYFPQDPDGNFEPFWEEVDAGPSAFLYVDDTTLLDVARHDEASRHVTTTVTRDHFWDLKVGRDLAVLEKHAGDIGMKINAKKTQLLVISPPNGCVTTGAIGDGESNIQSIDSLRLVGFNFGSSPDVGAHVESICEQYKRKKWLLYHLRDAGFKDDQLFRMYCCYVRSMIEYCSPVYHSLLSKTQEQQLERLQRHAVRVCYGHNTPVEEIMTNKNIETLAARRRRRIDKFIHKAAANPRFASSWFPPRDGVRRDLRVRREIQESGPSTTRRYRSPLAYMKRRANELNVQPCWGRGQ